MKHVLPCCARIGYEQWESGNDLFTFLSPSAREGQTESVFSGSLGFVVSRFGFTWFGLVPPPVEGILTV
jgi:hypothetical protein